MVIDEFNASPGMPMLAFSTFRVWIESRTSHTFIAGNMKLRQKIVLFIAQDRDYQGMVFAQQVLDHH